MSRTLSVILVLTGAAIFFFTLYLAIRFRIQEDLAIIGVVSGSAYMLIGYIGALLRFAKLDHAERQKCLGTVPEIA